MREEQSRFQAALRTAAPRQVSIGAGGISLANPDELDERQLGYARASDGRDLTGRADGQWRASWLVFGNEEGLGDPIFVDLSDAAFPVFTAAHGMGAWSPTLVAESFAKFVQAMGVLERYSEGRSHPVGLEEHPLTKPDRTRLVEELACVGAKADRNFWIGWFDAVE
jgi:hypothetical protein